MRRSPGSGRRPTTSGTPSVWPKERHWEEADRPGRGGSADGPGADRICRAGRSRRNHHRGGSRRFLRRSPAGAVARVRPHSARIPTLNRAGKTQIQKVRALCPLRVWILRQPPPTKGRPKTREPQSTPFHAGLRLPPGPPSVRESKRPPFTLKGSCSPIDTPRLGQSPAGLHHPPGAFDARYDIAIPPG